MLSWVTEQETESPPARVRMGANFSNSFLFHFTGTLTRAAGRRTGNGPQEAAPRSRTWDFTCADQGGWTDTDGTYEATYVVWTTGQPREAGHMNFQRSPQPGAPAGLQEEDVAAQGPRLQRRGREAGLWSAAVWLPDTAGAVAPCREPHLPTWHYGVGRPGRWPHCKARGKVGGTHRPSVALVWP